MDRCGYSQKTLYPKPSELNLIHEKCALHKLDKPIFLIVFPLLSVRSSLESRCPHNMPWSFWSMPGSKGAREQHSSQLRFQTVLELVLQYESFASTGKRIITLKTLLLKNT